jgi:hypothetical protein
MIVLIEPTVRDKQTGYRKCRLLVDRAKSQSECLFLSQISREPQNKKCKFSLFG